MDRSLMHQLLEQRCNESPGGQTPLARLISNRPPPNAVFTALLEISNPTPLEMLDGAGYTPLHIVRFLISFFLDVNPAWLTMRYLFR